VLENGKARVIRGDLPSANGITFYKGRLFVGECRPGGRILELDLNGGAPRVLVDNLMMPNAMEVGPDGMLYYPTLGTNDIWRVNPNGGKPERVAGDLGVPDAVKFDAKGFIVSTQVHSGEVLRIDPRSGERRVLARLDAGLDNLTFAGDRLFVSHFTGQITEILNNGQTKTLLPGGLTWPHDLAPNDDGNLYVADGTHLYTLQRGGKLQTVGMMFSPGWPGVVRGMRSIGPGELIVTTASGTVARYAPAKNASEVLAEGLDQPYGVVVAPGGTAIVAELGAGRVLAVKAGTVEVLAAGLREPTGVAIDADGNRYVSEAGAGRVVKLTGSGVDPVVEGLTTPQGMLVRDGILFIVDAGAKTLVGFDLKSKSQRTIASGLPVGAPPGVVPKPLRGLQPFSGPQGPFAGIAAGHDGTLFVSGDADGTVLAIRKNRA
jgi:sugar lactone lactonase YvrE